jgi:cytochrome c556
MRRLRRRSNSRYGIHGCRSGTGRNCPAAGGHEGQRRRDACARTHRPPIVRGEAPWNAQAAGAAAASARDAAARAKTLFPAGTGPDKGQTAALPAIWERKAEFDAIFDRQVAAASNLVTLAAANDEAGFKAGFAALGQTCGACHTPFRRPAN